MQRRVAWRWGGCEGAGAEKDGLSSATNSVLSIVVLVQQRSTSFLACIPSSARLTRSRGGVG